MNSAKSYTYILLSSSPRIQITDQLKIFFSMSPYLNFAALLKAFIAALSAYKKTEHGWIAS